MYMDDKYIYINDKSLCEEVCDEIITEFNKSNYTPGTTSRGIDTNMKLTYDFVINGRTEWKEIESMLYKELNHNIKNYIEHVGQVNSKLFTDSTGYNPFNMNDICVDNLTFQIQKYINNKGLFSPHHDFNIDKTQFRIFTYIWYLNDVNIGGETVFNPTLKITPKTGRLVIFPACWTFPHQGKMPISNDKYIITGWVYKQI